MVVRNEVTELRSQEQIMEGPMEGQGVWILSYGSTSCQQLFFRSEMAESDGFCGNVTQVSVGRMI